MIEILVCCFSFRVIDVSSEWQTFSNKKSRVGDAEVRQVDCVTHEKSLLSRLKICLILYREVVMWGILDYHQLIWSNLISYFMS